MGRTSLHVREVAPTRRRVPAMVFTSPRPGSSGVEQLTRNEQVAGSNPASGSKAVFVSPSLRGSPSVTVSPRSPVNDIALPDPEMAEPGLSFGFTKARTLATAQIRPSGGPHRAFVPAYFGPWETRHWATLVKHRPAAVVVNPASGPGTSEHHGYRALVASLHALGIGVYGYIATNWLQRTLEELVSDTKHYADWYGVHRPFFDEIPNGSSVTRRPNAEPPTMLRELANVVGEDATVFNCGQPIPSHWYESFPNVRWGTFEGDPTQLASSSFLGPAERQIHFVHSVVRSRRDEVAVELARRDVGFTCVTSDPLPNPWDVCPDPVPPVKRTRKRPTQSPERA